jgi:O-antigen/teichoic acid export membrane protein
MREVGSQGKPVFWSLADQGAVSLGNFLTNVLLARALAPGDYGVFALVYGMLILMNSYHSSAVVYPLSLSGAPGTLEELHHQIRRSICFTLIFAFPLGLVVFGAALFLKKPGITAWVIFALVCWQLQETLRRGLMAHLRHAEAIWGDTLSYLGQAGMIWFYLRAGHSSLATIFGILGVTSLLASTVQIRQLHLRLAWEKDLLAHARGSWRVSRWAVLANTAVVVPGVAYPWFLALQGTYLAASYQALLNIIGVSNPVMMSVGNFVMPTTIRANANGGWKTAGRVVVRYGLRGAALLGPAYALICLRPDIFLRVFYGASSPYMAQQSALRLLALAFSVGYCAYLLAVLFYGLGESKAVFRAQAAGAAVALAFGVPLIFLLGIRGASLGVLCVYAAQLLVFCLLLRRMTAADETAISHVHGGGAKDAQRSTSTSPFRWTRVRKGQPLQGDARTSE